MTDKDKTYLLKELMRTIDELDSTAAFCLCQRWILKDALDLIKEQESVIKALKSDLDETLAVLGEYAEIVRCRDCVHAKPERVEDEIWCPVTCSLRSMDWFCADGERKHDDG